jgi:hypothetical protein
MHLLIEPPVTARKEPQRVVNKQTHHKHPTTSNTTAIALQRVDGQQIPTTQ